MALFDNSSLLLVKSDLKLRGTKEMRFPATRTLPKSMKINKIKNPRNGFLSNPIKWDGAQIMKSHPNRATTVNLWSPKILKNISEFVKGSKGFNDSLYSFVKVAKTIDMVKSVFAWIIKAVKGRGAEGELVGKGGADGQETGDKGGTDGNAAGSGVDSNDAAFKGGAARGRGEAGDGRGQAASGGGQAAGGGGQAAGGGGLRVEFVFAFSLSAGS